MQLLCRDNIVNSRKFLTPIDSLHIFLFLMFFETRVYQLIFNWFLLQRVITVSLMPFFSPNCEFRMIFNRICLQSNVDYPSSRALSPVLMFPRSPG